MEKFEENAKVEYYVLRDGKRIHRLGYIKSFKKFLWFARYFVCAADKTREVDCIKPSQIFGLTDFGVRKENKFFKTENNGD